MPRNYPILCDVIIIGGGVAGASTAMQLALRGKHVVVLERQMLGAGSTGRAAGLLGQLRSTRAATAMLVQGLEIVRDLERRTGNSIFVETGSVRVAATPERAGEIRDHIAMGKQVGLAIESIDRQRTAELLPYMRTDDLIEICYCPTDGHLQPAELLASFVQVARGAGAEFFTDSRVERVMVENGAVRGVMVGGQEIEAPVVVNATGPWSYLVAELAETRLPTAAIGHYYLTTTPQAAQPVDRKSPAVRDRQLRIYSRPEAGGLLVGMYEAEPVEYEMEKLGWDFDMSQMRAARNQINVAELIDATGQRFPFVNERTPMTITTGIMTFTPDGKPFCGKYPDIEGLYHCAGFSGHGIVQSPAIGLIMSELILDGQSQFDIHEIEADRYYDVPELAKREVVRERCRNMYGNYYGSVMQTDVEG
jgi:4-methylaminobutanoate oxidase (formaldehyde-forming)